MLDLLITNAAVIDGTGAPAFRGEVGVERGRIVMVRRLPEDGGEDPGGPAAVRTIDAGGKVVCPGFIDLHSHSDRGILRDPAAESSLLMGVTTEITGNCGGSMAPLSSAAARLMQPRVGDLELDWRTMDEFLARLERTDIGNNHGLFVGQGTVRSCVMGMETRFPTEAELDVMVELVRESMEAGAFGISTGRAYVPGCFGGLREVVTLTGVVGEHLGLYTSHIADQWANVHRATWEVVEIGVRTGAVVQVAHQKVVGKDNWGRGDEVLAILEEGRDMGVDIMADVYPYPFAAVMALDRVLPASLRGESDEETLSNLGADNAEDTIRRAFREEPTYVTARLPLYGLVQCEGTGEFEGLDMGEAALRLDTDLAGAVYRLLVENELCVKVAGIMSEEDVRSIVAHPLVMIGSDSGIRNYGRDREEEKGWSTVHPREYGTFPRVLGKYVREERLLTLEDAVYKMTGLPAERIQLPDRGVIARGFWADLVIFDPEVVTDCATIAEPCQPPEGLEYVIVNGQVAVHRSEIQPVRAGQVLRDTQGRVLY